MKKYTQEEALKEIFEDNDTPLSNNLTVQKHRYKNKELSQKVISIILEEHGFKIIQTAIYGKV
jgi:hypothetical protein